jgi:hypothetical protein
MKEVGPLALGKESGGSWQLSCVANQPDSFANKINEAIFGRG